MGVILYLKFLLHFWSYNKSLKITGCALGESEVKTLITDATHYSRAPRAWAQPHS